MTKQNLILVSFVAFIVLFVIFVYRACFAGYYEETSLADEFLISKDWKEIESSGRIKIEKDKQFIEILLEPPDTAWSNGKSEIRSGDRTIHPEIKLIDSEGTEYLLKANAGRLYHDKEFVEFGFDGKLPTDKTFSKLMLRSDEPLKVRGILWAGYNFRDLP